MSQVTGTYYVFSYVSFCQSYVCLVQNTKGAASSPVLSRKEEKISRPDPNNVSLPTLCLKACLITWIANVFPAFLVILQHFRLRFGNHKEVGGFSQTSVGAGSELKSGKVPAK